MLTNDNKWPFNEVVRKIIKRAENPSKKVTKKILKQLKSKKER